ncbi:hypothetical protein J2T13_000121 [Paenibacillus sp. DS2015]|uniref:hypothetical protein n=1 Tax=Paenibacillus sp. DS2015 TaxID=3373917 RepID=UPI003D2153F1
MKSLPYTSKFILALLCMNLMLPFELLSATGSMSQAGATNTAQAKPAPEQNRPDEFISTPLISTPVSLQSFATTVIQQLSAQKPFASWKDAELQYFPLGPGTRSWLVIISQNQKKDLGYLILSAKDNGSNPDQSYILSEYGSAPSIPYNLTMLRQTLVQLEIIPTSFPNTIKVEALYVPLLPLWKISSDTKEAVYINALTLDVLPWGDTHFQSLSDKAVWSKDGIPSSDYSHTSTTPVSYSAEMDPYNNLLWITSPKVPLPTNQAFTSYMKSQNSLIFTAPNRNDDYGSPFNITGFQEWSSMHQDTQDFLYVGTGLSGNRYIPLSLLRKQGEFRALPEING